MHAYHHTRQRFITLLAGYPASLETLSPGLSPPPSLVPLSPLSYSSLPSTLPPSDYPVSLRITAFYFEIFAPNPPRRMGVGWGLNVLVIFSAEFFFLSIFSAVREIYRTFEMLTPNPPPPGRWVKMCFIDFLDIHGSH